MRIIPFTKLGFEDLKKKLEAEISKRPEAVKQLTRGREMGDLSENGLYKAAKQELNDIDREIRHLRSLLMAAREIIPTNNDYVQIGHKITVETEDGKKEFLIVGEYEADPKQNKISNKSPIGHNLMGRKVSDEIIINTPKGKIKYKINSIA
jgi:transcription elongation factor GreA